MANNTTRVVVWQGIDVTVDESKFTPEFRSEFRRDFYDFLTIEDHIEHLAQLYARGIVDEFTTFIEGYGDPKDFGIKFKTVDTGEQIVPTKGSDPLGLTLGLTH